MQSIGTTETTIIAQICKFFDDLFGGINKRCTFAGAFVGGGGNCMKIQYVRNPYILPLMVKIPH